MGYKKPRFYFLARPNWNQEIEAGRKFVTTVTESLAGKEKRSGLADLPKRSLEFTVDPYDAKESAYMIKVMHRYQHELLGIPQWPEYAELASEAASGQNILACDSLSNKEFAAGDEVVITGSDWETYEIGTISSITGNNITLKANLISTWAAGSEVYPVLPMRVTASLTGQFQTDHHSGWRMSFNESLEVSTTTTSTTVTQSTTTSSTFSTSSTSSTISSSTTSTTEPGATTTSSSSSTTSSSTTSSTTTTTSTTVAPCADWGDDIPYGKSHYSNNTGGSGPNDMADDDISSAALQNFSYIAVDLSAPRTVERLRVALHNSYSLTQQQSAEPWFQGSNNSTDGSDGDWDNITQLTSGKWTAPGSYPGWCLDEIFSNATAYKWYRINGTNQHNNNVMNEWEMFECGYYSTTSTTTTTTTTTA